VDINNKATNAARIMLSEHTIALPVANGDNIVGLINRRDIIRAVQQA
jgi:CBS domain-containing protein